MDITLFIRLYVLCLAWVSVRTSDSEEQLDPLAMILEKVYDLQGRVYQMEIDTRARLDEHIDELMDELHGNTRNKIERISAVVAAIERRLNLAERCPPGICGENGACDLSDRPQGYECICDSTHHGDNCEREFGPCEAKFRELENRAMMPGMELPRCDEDGFYLGMQYRGSMALCFTRDGQEINGYSVPRWTTGGDMDCKCARDELAHTNSGEPERVFSCEPNGSYASSTSFKTSMVTTQPQNTSK